MCRFQAEEVEEVELYAPADDDGGRGGGAADPQAQAGQVVEDHSSGGAGHLVE